MLFIDSNNIAQVLIHADVTEEMAEEIQSFIYGLEFLEEVKEINVSINSLGGSVLGGYSIFSALLNTTKNTSAIVEGLACSIASWIFLACTIRKMRDFSLCMFHNPSGGDDKSLLAIKKSLMVVYSQFFTDENELNELLNEETWFSPEILLEKKLINNIIYTSDKEVLLDKITDKTNLIELHSLCNKIINKNSMKNSKMDKNLLDKFMKKLEKMKNAVTLKNAEEDEDLEKETKESEDDSMMNSEDEEVEKETKDDESGEDDESEEGSYQDELMKKCDDMINVIQSLLEKMDKVENENKSLKNTKSNSEKIKCLKDSGIEDKDFDKWLHMDLENIKSLTKTIKMTKKSPTVNLKNEGDIEIDFNKLSHDEKMSLFAKDKDKYYDLFKKAGQKK